MISEHKIFFDIISKDRISGTDGNFTCRIDIPKDKPYDHVCLLSSTIPKTFYLISEGSNTFILREDAKEITISVPPANYDRRKFRAVVEDLLNKNSPNSWVYTITYPGATDPDTGLFTYTCSIPDRSYLIMPERKLSHLHEQFGFDAGSVNVFAGGKLVSNNVIKFVINDFIFIRSNICQNENGNVLHGVGSASTPSFSVVNHHCPEMSSYAKKLSPGASNMYYFSITDEYGKPIDFRGGTVILQLVVYVSEKVYDVVKQAVGLYNAQLQEN